MLLYFKQKLFDLHVLTSLFVRLHTDTEWSFATWLLFRTKFSKSSEICYKLGQFQYNQSDFTPGPIQQSIFKTKTDNKAIYIGQLKEGTSIKEGIGIAVYSNGHTLKLNNKVYMRDGGRMVNGVEKGDIQQMQIQIAYIV